jgi:hypothetical protein
VETGPSQELGHTHLPHGRAENSQTAHHMGHEFGEAVHRFAHLDQRSRTFLVEASHPGCNGRRGHQHVIGGLSLGPPACRPQFQDGQPLNGEVVRSALGWDALHLDILEVHLLLNKEELICEAGNLSRARIGGIDLSEGCGQGESGERDGVDRRRTDPTRPVFGKR